MVTNLPSFAVKVSTTFSSPCCCCFCCCCCCCGGCSGGETIPDEQLAAERGMWCVLRRETVTGLAMPMGPAAAVAARSSCMRGLMTSILFFVSFLFSFLESTVVQIPASSFRLLLPLCMY